MDSQLTLRCFNISSSLPPIPTNNNLTTIPSHLYYNPNGKAISQLISSLLARSTFSIYDVQSFLKQVTSDNIETWDVSAIVKIKPVTSTIIYLSITLAIFIVLSVIFCIISCTNCCKREPVEKHQRIKKRKCSGQCIWVVLILLIGLLVIGQMIYIAYQVNRTKVFLDDSIKEMNQEIYPKEISIHLQHLVGQFEQLDQYSTQADSILIKASKSIFVKSFDQIFREKYFFDEIREFAIDSSEHMKELSVLIGQETDLPNATIDLFQKIQDDNKRMFDDLEKPLQELCDYANGSDTDIDEIILEALYQVHEQLTKLIDTIQKDFLDHMTSGENSMLMNKNLEDQIRLYIRLVGIILLVLVIIIGLIPIIFFILIIMCRLCHCKQNDASSNYRMNNNRQNRYRRRSQSSFEENKSVSSVQSSNGRSGVVLCCMRLFFSPMIIILIVIVLVSGVLYGVDLLAQGACRTAHDDQPFLVSFLIDELLGANSSDLIIDGSDLKTTVTTIIDDCENQIHFSEHFFENHLSRLDNGTDQAMNQLNRKIFEEFNTSIDDIDITSDLHDLTQLSNLVSSTDIQEQVQQIESDLTAIQTRFEQITDSVPTLPIPLVNQTINDFRSYVNRVLESTIDTCPLPLATIYKGDTLICHDFTKSLNGLWLSLFVYIFLIIFGLCICGLCLYKRSQSLSSNRSMFDMHQYQDYAF